jgi:glycine/D-amino acid oxidase-like deaminating enzyme
MRSERASPATAGLGRVVVVGGGLVGLATAWRLLQSRRCDEVTLLEKDAKVASQQSTHNSGVLHSGLYYKPGSEKAALSVRGLRQMVEFCREHGVRHEICGKIVVATDPADFAAGVLQLHRNESLWTEVSMNAARFARSGGGGKGVCPSGVGDDWLGFWSKLQTSVCGGRF